MNQMATRASADPAVVRDRAQPAPGPRVPMMSAITAVASGQLSRVRVARGPLLFVATVQSLGLVVLLRGVVHHHDLATGSAVVAGSTILVIGFVGLNLLAQRFGTLRASTALDYYAALPIPLAAVVIGTAASYASFAVPGAVVTSVVGVWLYGLPAANLWVVIPAAIAAALALAGVGAAIGLALPRPELATVAGQLGMTLVLFLGIIPPSHLPTVARALRVLVPGALAVDAYAAALRGAPDWTGVVVRLVATVIYGVLALALAARMFRRAVDR